MLDACTQCGKCVEACPSVQPAGIAGAAPQDVIAGVLDLVRTGDGPEASRTWANACTLSGECIKACDYGVNPRFLLAMARVAMAKQASALPERRRDGVQKYRGTSQEVARAVAPATRDRGAGAAGAGRASVAKPAEPPDFVFYTGCNVLKTPHIALLALDMMDTLGVSYQVMGGPSHCCGVLQLRAGDVEMSGRMGVGVDREAVAQQIGAGAVVVPELLRAVHRDDAAGHGAAAWRAALRDDAVPPLLARAASTT